MKIYCWEGYNQKKYLRKFNQKIVSKSFISDFQIANKIKKKLVKCDVLNINNAFIRDFLWKHDLIQELNYLKYNSMYEDYITVFSHLSSWTKNKDQNKIIGIAQRFGSFNFVINSNLISKKSAELNGYHLVKDNKNKYGILLFEDFNIMHISLAAGINPFKKLNKQEIINFQLLCAFWLNNAKVISSNYLTLNKKLNRKDIRFYLSGGAYTCSPARKEGFHNLMGITPKNKINNLKQGIIFTEITSIFKNKNINQSEKFLDYILQPEKCYEIAMSKFTCNPVLQMGNKEIFSKFSKSDLKTIQWDDILNTRKYSHEYQIIPDYKKLLLIFKNELNKNKNKII